MNQIDIKSGVLRTVLACKSSQQCSPSDLVGFVSSLSFSSLCVRRRGLLYMLLLSGEKVHWDPLYRLMPRSHGCVLVVPARPDFPEMTHKSAMKKRAGQPALASSSAA